MRILFKLTTLSAFILFFAVSCSTVHKFTSNDENLSYNGRLEKLNSTVALSGSASSVSTTIIGKTCEIYLKSGSNQHNYVSIEVDGKYLKRLRIENDSIRAYPIQLSSDKTEHIVTIYKATESSNGTVIFSGIKAEKIKKLKNNSILKIEFIGNSITCAMGADIEEIPCGTGEWFDQHNAYFSYASIIGRELNADILLSSVSGIGIYRNWNSIKGEEPIILEVYENLYLNTDTSKPYNFKSFTPNIVSICLGTNDFSDGDGIKERLPFNQETYVNAYIDFLKTVMSKYPNAKFALLNSPMVTGERNDIFSNCLDQVKEHFATSNPEKSIAVFKFRKVIPTGCGFHPQIKEHQEMADQLIPFFKNL